MRVRYLGYADENGERKANRALDVGSEYVVLAITLNASFGHAFLVLDRFESPSWFPAGHFDLVSDEVPSSWRIRIGGNIGSATDMLIAPESWLARGFFSDLFGDGDASALAAQSAFDHELQIILNES